MGKLHLDLVRPWSLSSLWYPWVDTVDLPTEESLPHPPCRGPIYTHFLKALYSPHCVDIFTTAAHAIDGHDLSQPVWSLA